MDIKLNLLQEIIYVYETKGFVTSREIISMESRPFAREVGSRLEEIFGEQVYIEEFHSKNWEAYSHAIINLEKHSREEIRQYMVMEGILKQ